MGEYPTNQGEFDNRFSTERACRDYLEGIRWPDGFRCPACGHASAWRMGREMFSCRKCGRQTSLTAGTVFEGTRKPLSLWFRAMWHVVGQKNGVSALGLQRVLGLKRYETTWLWLHKLRRAMVRPGRDRLVGAVEVDETYIGGQRKGKAGRGAEGKVLVLIMAENQSGQLGRIRLRRVANASAKSLLSAIQMDIEPGTTICTDGWEGYGSLPKGEYDHVIVAASSEIAEETLSMPHLVASHLKRWLMGTHHAAVKTSHIDYYLDEFTFRFNRRTSKSRGLLFYRLLQQAVAIPATPSEQIRGGNLSQPQHVGGT